MNNYILDFNEIDAVNIAHVGGKGVSLGEMTRAGFPIPKGFVLTTEAYRQYSSQTLPADVQQEILSHFDNLGAERVAVRSSAVAEDSSDASWAGQLESYLNCTRKDVIDRIYECWKSIKTSSASDYAKEQNTAEQDLVVAVVVQKMVDSEVSGVLFTTNPVTKDANQLMIESCFGLGELLVQGMITPDNFTVDKNSFEISQSRIAHKHSMMVYEDGETKEIALEESKKNEPTLSENQIVELAHLGLKIENHYGSPQDIEWALSNGSFNILQSRPITTL